MNDAILGGLSLTLFLSYHAWFAYRYRTHPESTVPGYTIRIRREWVKDIMESRETILAIQTLRNWMLAATLIGSASITIGLAVLAFMAQLGKQSDGILKKISEDPYVLQKTQILLFVEMAAFFCFANAARFLNHTGMLMRIVERPSETSVQDASSLEEQCLLNEPWDKPSKILNRGHAYFSMGLRLMFLSFPCLFWIISPYLMLFSTVILLLAIYNGDLM
ncbi:hypothetical protein EDD86DRAFT_189187 [Gorgonomyces haynaldii]|nr:hypothetical protein EDD86DRAFT_189187 [Gorgonomyces haynaldii]